MAMHPEDVKELAGWQAAIAIPLGQAAALGLLVGLTVWTGGVALRASGSFEAGGAIASLVLTGAFVHFRSQWARRIDSLAGIIEPARALEPAPVYSETVRVELSSFDNNGHGGVDWVDSPVCKTAIIKAAQNWATSGDRDRFILSRVAGRGRGVSRGEFEAIRDWMIKLDLGYRETRAANSPVVLRPKGRQFLFAWAALDNGGEAAKNAPGLIHRLTASPFSRN